MKIARVTSVYEGNGRNISILGEASRKDQAKQARMAAKARMKFKKQAKTQKDDKKDEVIVKAVEQEEKDKGKGKDDKNDDVIVVRDAEEEEKDKEGTTMTMMEKNHLENVMKVANMFEEYPTYEEEWMWNGFLNGWEFWRRYDAVMSGEMWFEYDF